MFVTVFISFAGRKWITMLAIRLITLTTFWWWCVGTNESLWAGWSNFFMVVCPHVGANQLHSELVGALVSEQNEHWVFIRFSGCDLPVLSWINDVPQEKLFIFVFLAQFACCYSCLTFTCHLPSAYLNIWLPYRDGIDRPVWCFAQLKFASILRTRVNF